MKIDGNQLGGIAPESTVSKPGAQEAAAAENAKRAAKLGYTGRTEPVAETGAASPPDRVDLSDLSQALHRLVKEDDAAREARVERLASDYAAGRLEIDAAQVAAKVVDDAFHNEG